MGNTVPLDATCGTCRWWVDNPGACHRYAPRFDGWPTTDIDDNCGEWDYALPPSALEPRA